MTYFGVGKLFDIKFAGYQQPTRHTMYKMQVKCTPKIHIIFVHLADIISYS